MTEPPTPPVEVTSAEFSELFRSVSSWGRWGERDQRGALNYLEPERVVAASRLVRDGTTVTLSLPMNTKAADDNPEPAVEHSSRATTQVPSMRSPAIRRDAVRLPSPLRRV